MLVAAGKARRMATFGEQMKSWRDALGLTQAAFGQRLGVTQQTVADWERNKHWPSADRLRTLAQYLGIEEGEMATAFFRFHADADRTPAAKPEPVPPALTPVLEQVIERVEQLSREVEALRRQLAAQRPGWNSPPPPPPTTGQPSPEVRPRRRGTGPTGS